MRNRRWMTAATACFMAAVLAAAPVMAESDPGTESAYEETAESQVEETTEVESASEAPAYESEAEEAESTAESETSEAEFADSSAESAESGAESGAEEASVETRVRPEYKASDYIKLGEYKGLKIEVEPIEITEEEIDERVEQEIGESEEGLDEITEGTVEEGDIANIDYEGKKDGVAFDGGTAEGFDLTIGSGTFIEGFEEGLIGVAIGDTVDLNLTFPENYGSEDLAGQDVVFTVKVNSVSRLKELDKALVIALTDGSLDSIEAYYESIKTKLEEEAKEDRDAETKAELLTMAAEASTIENYPQDLVDYEVESMTEYYKYYAEMYGTDFGTLLSYFLGTTEEEFPKVAEDMVKETIKEEFTINAIAEAEGLMPTGDEYKAACDALAETVGAESGEAMLEQYGEYAVNYTIAHDKVEDFLFENAVITEKAPEEDAEEDAESEAASDESAAESTEEDAASEAAEFEAADSEDADAETADSAASES